MTKDLKKMAENGYGHWLRVQIPEQEQKIKGWKNKVLELERKIEDLRWLINHHSEWVESDKADLKEIEEKYKEYEPNKEEF